MAVIIWTLIQGSSPSYSQDVHFAQVAYTPMLLNPGLTGAFSHLQVVVNYRNQWNSVSNPYQTINASFDARLQRRDADRNSFLAIGFNFFNDVAGESKMTTNQINLDLAYHIKMGKYSLFRIGIYGGMNQRVIDPNRGTWASQFDGSGINSSIGSGENFQSSNHVFMDAGAGVVYTFRKMKYSVNQNVNNNINIGAAVYHVNQPASSFINLPQDRLFMRYAGFINTSFGLGRSKIAIQPAIYGHYQNTSLELVFGGYIRYNIRESSHMTGYKKPVALSLGVFNRYKDALIAKAYFQYHQYSIGLAYDFNISKLTPATKLRGGFEIFLRFNLDDKINNPTLW
jgi:type IX secretion system PorP/SprF family membrane protein